MKTKLFISTLFICLSAQMLFGQQSTQVISKQQLDTILLNNTRIEPEWVTAFPSHYSNNGFIKVGNQQNIYLLNKGNITKHDTKGNILWQTKTMVLEYNESQSHYYIQNIILDNQGNLFVLANMPSNGGIVKIYSADSTFINYTITAKLFALIKYDSNGIMQKTYWYSVVGNSANFGEISIDKNGNFYLAGTYTKSERTSINTNSIGDSDAYPDNKEYPGIGYCLMKINNNMEKEWIQLGELNGEYHVGNLTTDNNGNLFITGKIKGTVKIGENYFSSTDHFYRRNLIVIKFDNKGNLLWANDFSRKEFGETYIEKIAADTKGNLYFAVNMHNGNTSSLSKITPGGKVEWEITVNSKSKNKYSDYNQHYSYFFENIVIDENDNVYFAGQGYQNFFSFPNKKTYQIDANFFIGSFNSKGELQFLKAAAGEGGKAQCRSIAIHKNNLFVLARYQEKTQFKAITLENKSKNEPDGLDQYSAWLAKYDLKKIYEK